MDYVHKDSNSCSKSEVDLFSVPPTQAVIDDSSLISVAPLNAVGSGTAATPIEFVIPASSENLIDLSSVSLALKIEITKANGDSVDAAVPVYPETNFLHTYFSQVEVCLNGKRVSSPSSSYPYKAYLETLINFSSNAKNTILNTSGYFNEEGRNAYNDMCLAKPRKIFNYYGKLHADILQQDRLMLNAVEVRIKLLRSPSNFHLNVGTLPQGSPDPDFVVKILDTELFVRQVKITPHQYLSIERNLSSHNAKYPIRRVETRNFTIPAAITYKAINNIVIGKIPQKVIFGILRHDSEAGNYRSSCFHFTNSDLQNVSLCLNGGCVGKPYDLDFSGDAPDFVRPYYDLFATNGLAPSGLTLAEYANTATLFSYDLSQDQCNNYSSHLNPVRYGELSLKLRFKTPLQQPITVLFYLEYSDVVEVTRSRSVLFDP